MMRGVALLFFLPLRLIDGILSRLCRALVFLYQGVISPWLPPACRFEPSCSHYAAQALKKHGALRGGGMACRRLFRCRPGGGDGYDPVPDAAERGCDCTTEEKQMNQLELNPSNSRNAFLGGAPIRWIGLLTFCVLFLGAAQLARAETPECDTGALLQTDDVTFCVSRYMGAFSSVELTADQYHQVDKNAALNLVSTWDAPYLPFQLRNFQLKTEIEDDLNVERILHTEVSAQIRKRGDNWEIELNPTGDEQAGFVGYRKGDLFQIIPDKNLTGLDLPKAAHSVDPGAPSGENGAVETDSKTPAAGVRPGEPLVLGKLNLKQSSDPIVFSFQRTPGGPLPVEGARFTGAILIRGSFQDVYKRDPRFKVISEKTSGFVRLVWPTPGRDKSKLHIERLYRPGKTRYILDHVVRFFWSGGSQLKHVEDFHFWAHAGEFTEEPTLLNPTPDQLDVSCCVDSDVDSSGGDDGVPESYAGASWGGLERRYFLLAVAHEDERSGTLPSCQITTRESLLLDVLMRAAPGRVLPAARNSCKPSYLLEKGADSCESMLDALGLDLFASQQQVINSTSSALSSKEKKALVAVLKQDVRSIVFAGPKDLSSLEAAGHEFEAALDFGWSWLSPIARLLLRLMQFFYSLVPQWGAAIFLLTVTVKVFLLYFTVKAYVSMRRMQQLKPEMDKIKERYKEDKQAQQKAMMDLYKRHKVNPLGGCLPMLIQMPIYFALYRTIYATPDLYQANLFLWINDLSKPDPYFILPILLAVIMFAQQKLSSVGDQQHKWLMMMLPVVFTALMLFLPSGLVFYILVNSALSILQQMYIYKRVPEPGGAQEIQGLTQPPCVTPARAWPNNETRGQKRMSGKRLEFDETQAEVYEHAARELAGFVEKTGRSVRVLGVSPPERKLLHTGLNDRADVANTSEGFGLFRYVRLDVQRVASVEEDETDPDMGEGPEE